MNTTALERDLEGDIPLSGLLGSIHSRRLEDLRQHLSGACDPHAGFWDRWAGSRYLTEQFDEAYRLECALVDDLLEHIDCRTAGALVDDRRSIDRLRADFEEIGGQRGTAVTAAAIACSLLATLRRWYDEIEKAVGGLQASGLSPQAREKLARLAEAGSGSVS